MHSQWVGSTWRVALLLIAVLTLSLTFPACHKTVVPKIPTAPDISTLTSVRDRLTGTESPITTSIYDAKFDAPSLDSFTPALFSPLEEMPRNSYGAFLLLPGTYEFEAQSYCLTAGTYAPRRDGPGYVYAPLKGPKADIVRHILQRSVSYGEIDHGDIQILLWTIIAQGDPKQLGPDYLQRVHLLLTDDEWSSLSHGTLADITQDVLSQVSLPEPLARVAAAESQLRAVLSQGEATYAEIEHAAILTASTVGKNLVRDIPVGRWSKHPDGYYIRYLPVGYPETRIEAYLPENGLALLHRQLIPSSAQPSHGVANLTWLDPSGSVAVPGDTNQQRLGQSGRVVKVSEGDNAFTRARKATTTISHLSHVVPFAGGLAEGVAEQATLPPHLMVDYLLDFDFENGGKIIDVLAGGPGDPARSDFNTYAQPESFSTTPLQEGRGVSARRATAVNKLTTSSLIATGLLRAAAISADRFAGALAAGDDFWTLEQGKATVFYKRQAGLALADSANSLDQLLAIMRDEGVQDVTITPDIVRAIEAQLRDAGWPQEARDAAALLKLNDQDLEELKQSILAMNPDSITGSFFGAAQEVSESLREVGVLWSRLPTVTPNWNQQPAPATALFLRNSQNCVAHSAWLECR